MIFDKSKLTAIKSSPIPALFQLWIEGFCKKKGSFYGERVIVFGKSKVIPNNSGTSTFVWDGRVISTSGSLLDNLHIESFGQENANDLVGLMEPLVTCALDGEYCTPYDTDNMYKALHVKTIAVCDECKKDFHGDVKALIKHLAQTGHKDGIFEKYPHWDRK